MDTKSSFRITPQLVLGLVVITLGILFTLDNLDILDARDYTRFWPVLLVIYGIFKMAQPAGVPGKVWGFVVFVVGSLLLMKKLDIVFFNPWDLWPIFLIMLGGAILWRAVERQRSLSGRSSGAKEAQHLIISDFVVMSGVERSTTSQDFRGGEITTIMGGCELDLRGASIQSGVAVLDVFAFWGGIEMKVPQDWSVEVQAMPILGGIEEKTVQPKEGNKKLIVKGYVVMVGVEIRN
ncbi:MAG TPA: hypothetical protein DCP63_08180 [Bacteroidetes bacterium]|nr:hypothetical protein [Bacteroidota bacterium]